MSKLLIAIGLWLARLGGWSESEPECQLTHLESPYLGDAVRLAGQAEIDLPNAGGEAKRHAVYARLIKLHPAAAHRDLALAIELALR